MIIIIIIIIEIIILIIIIIIIIIAPQKTAPTTTKFPWKIIVTQANSLQRVLHLNWGELHMGCECCKRIILSKVIFQDCNLGVKSDLLPHIF